ncbi:MAG: 4-hydroxyphenylpyruvate dioxygenase [Betaproteobacteria bacterium]|nr:4-hydroxyphenylpyruvate dioxygenase [Betaproteobacteria bacterium]
MQTDGFEFVEYAAPDPQALGALFQTMGFKPAAKHRRKAVTLYRQGGVNFIINAEPNSFAQSCARIHGPCVCAIAFRVKDASAAYKRAQDLGAWGVPSQSGPMELNIPAIKGIGDSLIYPVDRYAGNEGDISIYDIDFKWTDPADKNPQGGGLSYIDPLTHNVHRGRMKEWADFYARLFNFREVRHFDIEGKLTGLKSKAMTSPCGRIRIPVNESSDDRSQIQEYLDAYRGEGIQHIALATEDIYAGVAALRGMGVQFLATPDTYYDRVDERVSGHGEDLARLRREHILIDGAPTGGDPGAPTPGGAGGLLLQIFTKTLIGPIFFEISQGKGNEGFGEGNFKALFESIEEDQIRRGVLKPA